MEKKAEAFKLSLSKKLASKNDYGKNSVNMDVQSFENGIYFIHVGEEVIRFVK
jgi:hypothetical protein